MTEYYKQEGLLGGRVRALLEDHSGNIWIGSSYGLSKLVLYGPEKGNVVHYTEEEGLGDGYIDALLEDSEGNIWVATDVGILMFAPDEDGGANGTLTQFTEKEGLCNNGIVVLMEDRNGHIWVGTNDGKVWISRDAGANWIDLTDNVDMPPWGLVRRIDASHREPATAYMAVDYHLVMYLLPAVARLYFTGQLNNAVLSPVQATIMVALGLQCQTIDDVVVRKLFPVNGFEHIRELTV